MRRMFSRYLLSTAKFHRLFMGFLLLFLLCPIARAQQNGQVPAPAEVQATPSPAAGTIGLTSATIEAKRKEYAAQIDTVKKNIAAATVNTPTEVIDLQNRIIQLLERLDLILSQQLGQINQIETHKASSVQLKEQLAQFKTNGPAEKPPYSYLLLDSLRSQLSADQEKGASLENTIKSLQSSLDQAKTQAQEKNTARIQSKAALDQNQDQTSIPVQVLRHKIVQLEHQTAEETATLRRLELETQKSSKTIYEDQLAFLKERISWIEKDTEFLESDLEEQFKILDADNIKLTNDLKKAEDNYNLSQKTLESKQTALANASEQTNALIEEERFLRCKRNYYQDEKNILPKRLDRITDRKRAWQRRFDVVNGKATIQEMDEWLTESNDRIKWLETDIQSYNSILTEVRNELGTLTEKIEQFKEDKTTSKHLANQQEWLQKRITLIGDNVARAESLRRFHEKLTSEIKQQTQSWSWTEFLQYVKVKYDNTMKYAVWESEQEEQQTDEFSLTVSNIVAALAYLFIGLYIARLLSRHGIRFIMRRLGAHEGATSAIQSLSYYVFLIIVILLTFDAISIPLTAFAFLGGALAIGIGFGSQNILNNFISGIILLIERPIRVGDLIEVDGVAGKVTNIGPRCTRLTTFSNVDQLIPNSKLLENKVVNLTLEDTVIRTIISVGVAYGSDLRKVFSLIKKAVDEHGLINNYPEPFVTLMEFGDNAVIFEVRFWVTMEKVNRLIVESDVRHRIYHLFEEAGICIAFPQRDVHLDTLRPLEIRMMPNSPEPKEDPN